MMDCCAVRFKTFARAEVPLPGAGAYDVTFVCSQSLVDSREVVIATLLESASRPSGHGAPRSRGLLGLEDLEVQREDLEHIEYLGTGYFGSVHKVRVVSRLVSPKWGPVRFRLAPRTYDAPPWGVRVVNPTKSRNIHPKNIPAPFFPVARSGPRPSLGGGPRSRRAGAPRVRACRGSTPRRRRRRSSRCVRPSFGSLDPLSSLASLRASKAAPSQLEVRQVVH